MPSTPAGKTGYPKWNAAIDVPDGAAQDEALGLHFDGLIGESYATAADLPAAGGWDGRIVKVRADRSMRVWDAATSSWRTISKEAESGTIAWATGWSAGTRMVLKRDHEKVTLNFDGVKTTAIANFDAFGVIPAGFRPPGDGVMFPGLLFGEGTPAHCSIYITTGGSTAIYFSGGTTEKKLTAHIVYYL